MMSASSDDCFKALWVRGELRVLAASLPMLHLTYRVWRVPGTSLPFDHERVEDSFVSRGGFRLKYVGQIP